ncbi:MAG: S9 family peptidase [Bacteroidales bacterium]
MSPLLRHLPLLLAILLSACGQQEKNGTYRPEPVRLSSNRLTPETLWSFGRLGGVSVSPSGDQILFGITYYNLEEGRGYRDLYLMPVKGGDKRELTRTPENENSESWRPDGLKINYLSNKSGSSQLWEIDPDGTGARQITSIEGGITGYLYSPDLKKIAFTKPVRVKPGVHERHPDLARANARIYDDLMYRHWDEWVDSFSHIFIGEIVKGKLVNIRDIMDGEPWESPVRPFGGMEQIAWSPDGTSLVYTARKKEGLEYALSTNTDLYLYHTGNQTTINLTEGMPGYDKSPLFSPDGRLLAFESMERDGYESDRNRLMILELATRTVNEATSGFDQDVQSPAWTTDSRNIYFLSDFQATDEIYRYEVATGSIRKITEGIHNYTLVQPAGNNLIAVRQSMSKPDELYRVDPVSGAAEEISFINKPLLDQLEMGRVESRWVGTTDGKQMKIWVIYPPGFDPGRSYPALLYCQGGPQNTVSQFWSYRWNFQIMAAHGYIVVAPNRRGVPGFGKEWVEQISGDYGGQNMQDYLSAIDTLAAEPFVDENRLGAVGASYGGFSVYWLAGNHEGRFKAFIAHDGAFNMESKYLETEEMWFVNWDLGGPYWDTLNPVVRKSYDNSPHRFIHKWDTPILVIHGEQDFRVPASQGMQAFNAARLRGIPARLLLFPEENHWVLSSHNGILWQREFFGWLDQWLKR